MLGQLCELVERTSGTPAVQKYVLLSAFYTVTMFALVPDICVRLCVLISNVVTYNNVKFMGQKNTCV